MKNRLLFLTFSLCLLLFAGPAKAEGVLSDQAFASLVTCGAGVEVESFFGHTAIRVCDTVQGIDYVYNYGTYDFDQPHFYWTFARGDLDYCLSRTTYWAFLQCYIFEQRPVFEQRLNLTQQERDNLFVLLETNYQPEYRFYRYDFFRDNCATRPRDILESAMGHHRLQYSDPASPTTYRDVLYASTEEHLWWRLAFDIVLGIPTDHRCDGRELMFAPGLLFEQIQEESGDDGQPLVVNCRQLLPAYPEADSWHASPLVAAWCLLLVVLALTLLAFRYGWRLRWLDIILYGAGFLIALLLLFLWLGTNHFYTGWNLNLLWASPLWIYFLIRGKKSRTWVIVVQLALLALALLTALVGWPQQLNSAIIPIALIYFIRLTFPLKQSRQPKQ